MYFLAMEFARHNHEDLASMSQSRYVTQIYGKFRPTLRVNYSALNDFCHNNDG